MFMSKAKTIKELMIELGFNSIDYDTNVRKALVEVLQSRNKIQRLEEQMFWFEDNGYRRAEND